MFLKDAALSFGHTVMYFFFYYLFFLMLLFLFFSFFQVHLLVIFRLIFQPLDQVPNSPQSVLCMHEGLVYSRSSPQSHHVRPLCFLRPHQTESAHICTTVHKTTSGGPTSGVTAGY